MPDFRLVNTDSIKPADLHAAFAGAFSDYLLGPFNLPLAQWPQFVGRQAIDMSLGRAVLRDEQLVAFAFVAPRPELAIWRLATMGALPAARGTGAAADLLDDFIERAASAGLQEAELECFAQNERALRLYRRKGFVPVHPLHGYVRQADAAVVEQAVTATVQPVLLDEAFAWIDEASFALRDLPLQVTPRSLKALPVQMQALRSGDAQLVFSVSADGVLTIHSLIDKRPQQHDAQALAEHLITRHPKQRIVVPQLQRPDLGGEALERLGFERQPLHQLLMRRPL